MIKNIVINEGFLGLFKGLRYPIITSPPFNIVNFAANDIAKRYAKKYEL